MATMCKLAWGSTVYNLWRFRNDVKFGNSLCSEEKLLQKISWEVMIHMVSKGKYTESIENVSLCSNWGISQNSGLRFFLFAAELSCSWLALILWGPDLF
jgi:hypothetical protein